LVSSEGHALGWVCIGAQSVFCMWQNAMLCKMLFCGRVSEGVWEVVVGGCTPRAHCSEGVGGSPPWLPCWGACTAGALQYNCSTSGNDARGVLGDPMCHQWRHAACHLQPTQPCPLAWQGVPGGPKLVLHGLPLHIVPALSCMHAAPPLQQGHAIFRPTMHLLAANLCCVLWPDGGCKCRCKCRVVNRGPIHVLPFVDAAQKCLSGLACKLQHQVPPPCNKIMLFCCPSTTS
jgi:hypothetical protein